MAIQNNLPIEVTTINNAQGISPMVPADTHSTSSQEAIEPVLPYQSDADMMEAADENPLVTANTDSLTILRQQLQKASQRFARGVSNHLPMDQLESLRNEASHILNCIKCLLEVQTYYDPPNIEATQQLVNQSSTRFDHFIPNGLPTWQWVGNVWRMDVEVHDSVEDLLDTFTLIALKGRSLNWDEARSIIVNTYAIQDAAQTLNNIDQLLTIKMQQNESIVAFTDRFQRIRRAAKWQDDIRAAVLFKRVLPLALCKEVSRSLLNLPLNQQDSVYKVSAKARTVISNICNDEAMTAGVTKRNITTQSSATPISFVSGVEKSIHNPKNASGLSKQGQPQFKPKSKCFVHGKGNHTSEQCKVLKRITTANTATTTTKITLLTSSKKNCYKCSANILWNPGHATTCSRDKVERFNGPTKTFHSARFSCVHNRSKPSPAAVNLNDQEYNHGNIDIDLSSLPTNYDYSGASFSSIDITFANKNNININNNVSGSIIFATNDNKGKRLGTTSKALSLIYEKNKTAYRSPYRIPLKLMPVMRECVDTWLKDEMIEYASPSLE
ncbi:hypothetical protein G6F46_008874 [Rhizopus delemar]|uniref:Retrotransposon gag domain-containing protein n=2 Tax=Rhizopus TaxID=4842 RepID=A0A9P6YY11_9FUNG|nr:hypothetical protein G6F55_007795 [Rhizopus delemar]KAG1539534.1 hypothetical protein G6F51_009081 [Rhizopus arrhizus]KAG1493757.1 hypothetical protein G6F54_008353 [Rhizopus delemar]KAG1507837.1 hypothetical protein G6F53_008646 [Rhizopus delemar]KAG1555192.1 hypothetical protein G6F49_007367 [Rhizopus delemar]